jgi:hypothetical protein
VSVENNVHKEISAIKSIAETLLLSSNMQKGQNNDAARPPVNTRVATLENCMEGILDRLDSIASSVSVPSNNKHHS